MSSQRGGNTAWDATMGIFGWMWGVVSEAICSALKAIAIGTVMLALMMLGVVLGVKELIAIFLG